MNRKMFTLLLLGACLITWTLPNSAEARGGRGGGASRGGGGGFSRGGGGGFGSIRNSARPSTGAISRPSQSQVPNRLPSQQRAQGSDRLGQGTRPNQLPAAGSVTRPAQQPAGQRGGLGQRAENLTPAQKDQLRQKYENSGLKPSQLPSRDREGWSDQDREDWQDWREQNREDWQKWHDDKYDDYWDDHWHSYWWYGYPVSTVSYSFYIDDTPPCQKTVVINQTAGTTTYYYCNSIWYQPAYASGEVQYVIASPPAGAELTALSDPHEVTVGGQEFFVSNHVFYQKITRDGQTLYVTVDAPPGAEVPTIPEYAVEIEHQGQTYYRFDRIFYRRQGDFFVVVKNPGV
jgi:Family of unknown function (DUF6515)